MADNGESMDRVNVPTTVRTLISAGFSITNFDRQAVHGEVFCERVDAFGVSIPYLLIVAEDGPSDAVIAARAKFATSTGRVFLVVNQAGGDSRLSWSRFLASLGGPVPHWRALTLAYSDVLNKSAANVVPNGLSGEAWQIFEDAVADGFEYVLGWRVRRLGNRKRGLRVPDLVTKSPDESVLVIDTKASSNPFDVGFPELRPLVEYISVQHVRQTGSVPVGAAVVVAAMFKQGAVRLAELSGEFIAATRVPVTFLPVEVLLALIAAFRDDPTLRNKIHWRRMLCRGGLVDLAQVETELTGIRDESV